MFNCLWKNIIILDNIGRVLGVVYVRGGSFLLCILFKELFIVGFWFSFWILGENLILVS